MFFVFFSQSLRRWGNLGKRVSQNHPKTKKKKMGGGGSLTRNHYGGKRGGTGGRPEGGIFLALLTGDPPGDRGAKPFFVFAFAPLPGGRGSKQEKGRRLAGDGEGEQNGG